MPKKVEPKYGHRSRHFLGSYGEKVFTREQVESLAASFQIADLDEFERWLEGVADIYRNHAANIDDAPRAKHVRAALKEISSLSEALEKALIDLDDHSDRRLWRPAMDVERLVTTTDEATSPYGHTIERHRTGDNEQNVSYLRPNEIVEGITILKNYAHQALSDLPNARTGPSAKRADYMWISNAAKFWTETLNRRFTLTTHQGEGVTEAYRFCWETLQALGADVTPQNVVTEMRKVIRARRKRERKVRPPDGE